MKKLCVLKFETISGNKYIYDAMTGSVVAYDEILYDCIKLYEKNSLSYVKKQLLKKYDNTLKINAAIVFVKKYVKKFNAFYKTEHQVEIECKYKYNFDEEVIDAYLYKIGQMEQLVLNVTEDCNMRCKYCYLSETYKNTRNRTEKKMDLDVAISALDYFFSKMKKIKKINPGKICVITFYGGEPLLNFKLIKDCIEYIKKKCPLRYILNITTNGILLSGNIARYLVENNVYISVSLDGNKENNDRNRLDCNGHGTFEIVYNNLKKFHLEYPFYEKINVMSVFDYNTNLSENNKFFNENYLPRVAFINQVLSHNTDYYKQFDDEIIKKFFEEYRYFLEKYIQNKSQNIYPSQYTDILFELGVAVVLSRLRANDVKNSILPYTGTCVPGTKISVRTDGKFDICEKVDYNYSIGECKTGLNNKKIIDIIKDYNRKITSECGFCPLYKACTMCFSTAQGENSFEKKDCKSLIDNFIFQLSLVYSLYENNADAFMYFDKRIEWLLMS